jgi:hypothetical protein
MARIRIATRMVVEDVIELDRDDPWMHPQPGEASVQVGGLPETYHLPLGTLRRYLPEIADSLERAGVIEQTEAGHYLDQQLARDVGSLSIRGSRPAGASNRETEDGDCPRSGMD